MDGVYILDENFENVRYMDVFESLIWTTRYKEPGEFELYIPYTRELLDDLTVGRYVYTNEFYDVESDTAHLMIIESVELDDDHLKITGRSLRSILSLRIIWGQTVIKKKDDNENTVTVYDAIKRLVTEALIVPIEPKDYDNPFDPSIHYDMSSERAARVIPNFIFEEDSNTWPEITDDTQYDCENLLDVINDLCVKHKIGYEVVAHFSDKTIHMRMIRPVDHSWDQTDAPAVIFSPEFDNLKKSNYIESITNYKNLAIIRGYRYDDDELGKFQQVAILGTASGLKRRELYVDQSSLQYDDAPRPGDAHPWDTYESMLREKGKTELEKKEYSYTKVFDGEADAEAMTDYKFGEDYKIGDTVELITRYGESVQVRVTEMVLSASTSGITLIPTFEATRYEDERAEEANQQ